MSLLTNLVSWWKMDEESGTRYDAHGSNDLADNNTVLYAAGKQGNAADFESGNSEYLDVTTSLLQFGDEDFTLVGWIKGESNPSAGPIWGVWENGNQSYMVRLQGTVLNFFYSSDGSLFPAVTSSTSISGSTWYMVSMWHDSVNNSVGLKVNDGTPDTAAHTTGIYVSSAPFGVGVQYNAGSPSAYYDGLVDELGAWTRILTSDELTELYNSGNGLSYDSIPSAATGGPMWWYFERAKGFYKDLKAGLIPPDQLRHRYREVYI